MHGIRIFFLDDEITTLHSAAGVWRALGFEVDTASNSQEARAQLKGHERDFDVLVLDMLLKDETVTGADVGIEVRERAGAEGPEFLILSAYDFQEYYQKALLLGASAYLRRSEYEDPVKVASHLRALALRRALRVSSPAVVDRLRAVSRNGESRDALVERFCRELLIPELVRVLPTDFLLLLSSEDREPSLFQKSGSIMAAGLGAIEVEKALMANLAGGGRLEIGRETQELARVAALAPPLRALLRTPGSAVCQLVNLGGVRLTLGLVQGKPTERGFPVESAAELSVAVRRYLHPSVTEPLVRLFRVLAESSAEGREARRNSAKFCLAMGGEMLRLAHDLERASPSSSSEVGPVLGKLAQLGDELRSTGHELDDLGGARSTDAALKSYDMADLIAEVSRELVDDGFVLPDWQATISGHARVRASRDRVRRALQRLFRWFSGRGFETNPGGQPELQVFLSEEDTMGRLELCDASARIPAELRANLFVPLVALQHGDTREGYLGLYLAKEIIRAEGGTLEDLSDELGPGERGHRFVIRLPK